MSIFYRFILNFLYAIGLKKTSIKLARLMEKHAHYPLEYSKLYNAAWDHFLKQQSFPLCEPERGCYTPVLSPDDKFHKSCYQAQAEYDAVMAENDQAWDTYYADLEREQEESDEPYDEYEDSNDQLDDEDDEPYDEYEDSDDQLDDEDEQRELMQEHWADQCSRDNHSRCTGGPYHGHWADFGWTGNENLNGDNEEYLEPYDDYDDDEYIDDDSREEIEHGVRMGFYNN